MVHTGPEAVLAVAECRPNVVVLDIGLPGMDGYEVARRTRQDPKLEGMWLVGVSGYRQEPDGPLRLGARFDDYLLKLLLIAHVWGEVTHLGGHRVRKRLVFKDLLAGRTSETQKA